MSNTKAPTAADQINKIIQEMVKKNVFTSEALGYIKELEKQSKENTALIDDMQSLIQNLEDENRELSKSIKGLEKQEADVLEQKATNEAKQSELIQREWELKVEKAGIDSAVSTMAMSNTKEILEIVFKNPVYKKSYFKNASKPVDSGNGYYNNVSESENSEEKQEIE